MNLKFCTAIHANMFQILGRSSEIISAVVGAEFDHNGRPGYQYRHGRHPVFLQSRR